MRIDHVRTADINYYVINEVSDIGTQNNINILDKADLATSTPSGSLNIAGWGKSGLNKVFATERRQTTNNYLLSHSIRTLRWVVVRILPYRGQLARWLLGWVSDSWVRIQRCRFYAREMHFWVV